MKGEEYDSIVDLIADEAARMRGTHPQMCADLVRLVSKHFNGTGALFMSDDEVKCNVEERGYGHNGTVEKFPIMDAYVRRLALKSAEEKLMHMKGKTYKALKTVNLRASRGELK